MAMLDSGVKGLPRQTELAELLHRSKTSSELLEQLEKIPDPTPGLALEICRAFRREGRLHEGQRMLQKSNLLMPSDDESRRLYVQIQGELALCGSHFDDEKAYYSFADAVRSSIDLLGRTDEDTIDLRITYATFLERSSRYSGALAVLMALKVDSKDFLHPWTEIVGQMEERLRDKKVKKRRRERPMPAAHNLIEDDNENVHQSDPHGPSKKRKLMRETDT